MSRLVLRPGFLRQLLGPLAASLLAAAALGAAPVGAQTVGLLESDPRSFPGYTLFAPNRSSTTWLIDHEGGLVHSWAGDSSPGLSVYLQDDGSLLRAAALGRPAPGFNAGGAGGRVQETDWDGNLLWEFELATTESRLHHDVERLPNGNVLMIAWERKSSAEAIAAGRDPALLPDGELWPEVILEVAPTPPAGGTVVWEWHVWDHLVQDFDPAQANAGVVADRPELVDVNFTGGGAGADWLHVNAVDYLPEHDQIVLSVHDLSEIWVIDHSTTTAEAAGHVGGRQGRGGDLLYRWGNPAAYRAGTPADRQLFVQHDAQWIEPGLPGEGNLLVFNNGTGRPGGDHSSVDELVPPVDGTGAYLLTPGAAHDPAAPAWSYLANPPEDFYGRNISGAQRLPNGNTLICNGPWGTFFEVTPSGETVWRYVNPDLGARVLDWNEAVPLSMNGTQNATFRATRIPAGHPGLTGRDLTPGRPIEGRPPDEVSPPGSVQPLVFIDAATLAWEDGAPSGAETFHLYRGELGSLWSGDRGACLQAARPMPGASVPAPPPQGGGWFYLVTGVNGLGEGPMGRDSMGADRANAAPCP